MKARTAACLASHALLPAAAIAGGSTGLALFGAWAAMQAGITVEMLRPRSQLFGATTWRGPASLPRVALTFDDGPDPEHTIEALAVLEASGAPASFFFVGDRALRHPDIVRQVASAGHDVGVHSLTHPWWFSFAGPARIRREVSDAAQAIEQASGQRPAFFRPPMGHKNAFLEGALEREGLTSVTWTARAYDTVTSNRNARLARLLDGVGPGSIVLMHEARSRTASPALAIVAELVARLRERGLEPVTLRELLSLDPIPALEPPARP